MFKTLQLKAALILLALGFAVAVPIAIKIHLWRVAALEADWSEAKQKAVDLAVADQQTLCREAQAITKETNDELQLQKHDLDVELAAARSQLRQRGTAQNCARIASAPIVAEGGNQPVRAGKVLAGPGVSEDELLEFGARCTEIATTLNSCIDYTDKVIAFCGK